MAYTNIHDIPHKSPPKVIMIDGEPATEIVVHRFKVGDVEDPELYAAQPLWEWEQSESGQWVMANAVEIPRWVRQLDQNTFSTQYAIIARFKPIDITYFIMRWGT